MRVGGGNPQSKSLRDFASSLSGAYKSSVSLRKLAFGKKLISPLKGEVAASVSEQTEGLRILVDI